MKKILSFALFIFLSLSVVAQEYTSQPLKERYVYLWDVTISMVGVGDNPDIYDNIREMIIKDIKSIPQNEETEIVVVAFRGNLEEKGYKVWKNYANNRGKEYLTNEMMGFETDRTQNMSKNKHRGKTNTYTALKYVVDDILTADRVDYLKIMTDGGCDEAEAFQSLISRWCEIKDEKNVYAYYITLTDKAHAYKKKVEDLVDADCFMFIEDKDAIALVRQLKPCTETDMCYNILKDKGEELKYKFDISLGDGKLDSGFKIHCKTANNATNNFFRIDTVIEFNPSHKTITLIPQIDKFAHHKMGSNEEREVELEFTAYDKNDKKFRFVVILNNTQRIILQNSEQTLKLDTKSVECNVRESNSKIKLDFSCNRGELKPGYKINYRCEYFDEVDKSLFSAKGTGALDDNLTLTITPEVSPKAKNPNKLSPNKKYEYANIVLTPADENHDKYRNVTFDTEFAENKCKVSLLNNTLRTVKIRYVK